MKKLFGRLAVIASVLVLLLGLGFLLLPRLAVDEAENAQADALYLMVFDPRLRTDEYAVQLYRQGLVKKLVCVSNAMTCDVFPADYARQHLIALGVPESDVLMLHTPDTDCRAQLFPPMLKFTQEQGWRRIVWLVDPAGSRMTRRVHQPRYRAQGIEMWVTYPPDARTELLDGWWREHWKVQRLTRDALETTLDWFYVECW